MPWRTVWAKAVDFDASIFASVMDLLLREPNIISPSILRAEIQSDTTQEGKRMLTRLLVPRQHAKDVELVQHVNWSTPNETGHLLVHSTPLVSDPSKLPYYYPHFEMFSYSYADGVVEIRILPYANCPVDERWISIWDRIGAYIVRFGNGTRDGYKKRVHHDQIIDKVSYQNRYRDLKDKYANEWVAKWCEKTDARKHVFEDLGIATFMVLLWEREEREEEENMRLGAQENTLQFGEGHNGREGEDHSLPQNIISDSTPQSNTPLQPKGSHRKYKFADIGCGNGFLTFLLTSEGYTGVGMDQSSRALWSLLPNSDTYLSTRTLHPPSERFDEVDWIIGNHPDELTCWVPVWAARSGCKFVVIPCCPFGLNGVRMTLSPTESGGAGRYEMYCSHVRSACTDLGYTIEREILRIPSTKNVCLVGRRARLGTPEEWERWGEVERARGAVAVTLRKSDRERTEEWFRRKEAREKAAVAEEGEKEEEEEEFDLGGTFLDLILDA